MKFKKTAKKYGYSILSVDTLFNRSIRYSYSKNTNYYESLLFTIDTLGQKEVTLRTLKPEIFDSCERVFLREGFYKGEFNNLVNDKLNLEVQEGVALIISESRSKSIDTFVVNSIGFIRR